MPWQTAPATNVPPLAACTYSPLPTSPAVPSTHLAAASTSTHRKHGDGIAHRTQGQCTDGTHQDHAIRPRPTPSFLFAPSPFVVSRLRSHARQTTKSQVWGLAHGPGRRGLPNFGVYLLSFPRSTVVLRASSLSLSLSLSACCLFGRCPLAWSWFGHSQLRSIRRDRRELKRKSIKRTDATRVSALTGDHREGTPSLDRTNANLGWCFCLWFLRHPLLEYRLQWPCRWLTQSHTLRLPRWSVSLARSAIRSRRAADLLA